MDEINIASQNLLNTMIVCFFVNIGFFNPDAALEIVRRQNFSKKPRLSKLLYGAGLGINS
jgi:hypothetical protein